MKDHVLESDTIQMRRLESRDIPIIIQYASDYEIARNTYVPQPYSPQDAVDFVATSLDAWDSNEGYTFAIIDKDKDEFVGVMGLHPEHKHHLAEVGYWIGKPFWGQGYATQALRLLIQFGFETVGLNRIQARYFTDNPASGRVMQKAEMTYEGIARQAMYHRESYKDVVTYAILREDYDM